MLNKLRIAVGILAAFSALTLIYFWVGVDLSAESYEFWLAPYLLVLVLTPTLFVLYLVIGWLESFRLKKN
jgi:hypothetical protein